MAVVFYILSKRVFVEFLVEFLVDTICDKPSVSGVTYINQRVRYVIVDSFRRGVDEVCAVKGEGLRRVLRFGLLYGAVSRSPIHLNNHAAFE